MQRLTLDQAVDYAAKLDAYIANGGFPPHIRDAAYGVWHFLEHRLTEEEKALTEAIARQEGS